MKPILGFLLIICLVGCFFDTPTGPTGPKGRKIEVDTEKWSNGNIKVEYQFYRDGVHRRHHGYYKEYYENGQIKSEGKYKQEEVCIIVCLLTKRQVGEWVEYYENGQIKWERNYNNGKYVSYRGFNS